MNKKTILKPVAAMLLALVMLLTGVVPGTLATAKAAENDYYLKYEYVDADGEVKESAPIENNGTVEIKQGTKGYFYAYKNGQKVEYENADCGRPVMVDSQGRAYIAYDFVQTTNNAWVDALDKADMDGYISVYFTIKIVVDTTDLDAAIAKSEQLNQSSYSTEGWASFTNAVGTAKSWKDKIATDQGKKYQVAENEVKQQNIDDATAALNTAILNLKKEDLQKAITEADAVVNDNYTEESWTAFQNAVNDMKVLQTKEDVTEEDIDNAIEAVAAAKNALQKKAAETVTTEKKNDTTTSKKNETDGTKKPAVKKYTVAKTTLKKAKKSGKKVQLRWKKVNAATGYQVYQATKKNGKYKKVKTIKKNKIVTCKTKALKAKKTYYFKVRTYRKVAGKTIYGAFSNVKKVTVK